MTNDENKLDLLKPGLVLLIFLVIVGAGLYFLNNLDKQRKAAVYERYAAETKDYVAKNRPALITLFNQAAGKNLCTSQYPSLADCIQTQPFKDQIDHKLTHDLKDWSSTMFIVPGSGDRMMNQMRLSGDLSQYYGYPEDKVVTVLKLLNGEVEEIPWDDYSYELAGKEVIVSVKDDSGKVAGLIMRGVIEDKSF